MRRYFIAGLIVWVPILGTFYILRFIVRLLDGSLALLPARYHPYQLIGHNIPGLGLVITLLILLMTGIIASNILGKKLVLVWDKMLDRIPLVRGIYNAFKQIMTTIANSSGDSFSKVLLIEYPRHGIWSIAFQTSSNFGAIPLPDEMLMVFVPTTPNPTSGFLMAIPKKDSIILDVSVEEALKLVVSLGVVIPRNLRTHQGDYLTPEPKEPKGPKEKGPKNPT